MKYALWHLVHVFLIFPTCCRPTIAIDGTHLKGKNKGILFIATTIDSNDQIFLIAFGVGDIENDRSWT